jgi:vibriolysin
MKKNIFVYSLIFTFLIPSSIFSAEKKYLEDNKQTNTITSSISFASSFHPQQFNKALGFSKAISLYPKKVYSLKNGTVTRYIQKYKNIPIIHSDIIIANNTKTSIQKARGMAFYGLEKDLITTTPNFSSKEALQYAKDAFITTTSLPINNQLITKEKSELKIWQNKKGLAVLVYEVSFMYEGNEPSYPYYILDASNGKVLNHYDTLMHAQATGPGGNIKTGQYNYGSNGLGYLDVIQNGNTCTMDTTKLTTLDLNHAETTTQAIVPFDFTCPDNTYQTINDAYSPLNDAHFFGTVVYDMYQTWFGISPLTQKLILQVHYGTNYENAFWDGSRMSFGDGATTFYPLVDLNVLSHEVSHGFTQQNSNLAYTGKSGGLNESFSDMAGEAAEFYHTGTNDWYVGADIMKNGVGLRSMSDPTSIGSSIDDQKDYYDGLDVHLSSGVYNKAFYLLSTTAGWTTQKAFEVYVKANQLYWTSTTDWDRAGAGVLSSATDLGYSETDVCISLNTVGIYPSVPSCPAVPPIPPLQNSTPILFNQTKSGTWDANTVSIHHANSYAKYYTFSLAQSTLITIDLASSSDTYLLLLNGADSNAPILTQDDDGGTGLNSRISMTLNPGTYTIEATTYDNQIIDSFTLRVSANVSIPTTPTSSVINKTTPFSVQLNWAGNDAGTVGYRIYQGTKLIATVDANTHAYIIGGLSPNTQYTYTIKAYNSAGTSSALNVSIKTTKDNYGWLIPITSLLLN